LRANCFNIADLLSNADQSLELLCSQALIPAVEFRLSSFSLLALEHHLNHSLSELLRRDNWSIYGDG